MRSQHAAQRPTKHPPGGSATAQSPPATTARTLLTWQSTLISIGVLAVLTLAMFGDALFTGKSVVLSNRGADLAEQFLDWRSFGFGELKRGNLALWNPHLFSGAPYFGGFQPALLYPLNALFLVLPLSPAINWTIALHVFLAGAFTHAWAIRRGLRPTAAVVAAAMFMFGGAHFLHIYAGHLSNLCTMIWAPLLFLAIDGLAERPSLRWTLLGTFAVAMQVLAGHPQYVFYTGVAAATYCALCFRKANDRKRFVLASAGMAFGGVALSAVQLFTGFQEASESVRSIGMAYEFAAMFSFPPENLLTLFSPNVFGNLKTLPYWGRCYLWEMSLFMGISGFALGIAGAVLGERRTRNACLAMIALLVLLALGSRTPLFTLLYHWMPGFDQFRGSSKFIFLVSLFFAMLAGTGFNELLKGRHLPPVIIGLVATSGLLLLLAALLVWQASSGSFGEAWWRSVMLAMRNSGESYLSPHAYDDPAFALQAGRMAARSLLIGGATMAVVVLSLCCLRKHRPVVWVLPGLAVIELFVFARLSLDTFDPAQSAALEVKQYLEAHPGDYRVLNLNRPNTAMRSGAQEIWGDDPGVTLRYAQVIALTQDVPPDRATQYMPFSRDHPLLGMLRCRAIFSPGDRHTSVVERPGYVPHVLIVPRFRVLKRRDQIFAALSDPSFNPREEVILEEAPGNLEPTTREPGTATISDSSTDHLTIDATAPSGGILLIADAYAKGWRARDLAGSNHYQLMPANYCLRAIPLNSGQHRLRVEYVPSGFAIGRWVSLITLLIFGALAARECWLGGSATRRRPD